MASQATYPSVYDASFARQNQLSRELLALEADYQDAEQVEARMIDLRFGLENIGMYPSADDALTVQAYVQENYGLLSKGLDPLLTSLLPVIPAQGAQVRAQALLTGGRPVLVNGQPVIVGYRLAAVTAPTYNTTLLPTQTAGPVTYNGVAGTQLSFDAPLPTGGALFLKLYVGGVQVGRVDFPAVATGAGFSLLYQGNLYYGTFQTTSDNTLTLSL